MPNKPYDRPLRGNRCQCQGCFEYFNSTYAFDEHRAGNWADQGRNRRCLTPDEMVAHGMSLNPAGYWITETRVQRALRSGGIEQGSGQAS